MSSKQRFGRRDALVGMGATALGAVAVAPVVGELAGCAAPGAASLEGGPIPPAPDLHPPDEPVLALFDGLEPGSPISTRWRLEGVYAMKEGAIPVVLATLTGERFAVEIFRDATRGPEPIARAEGLALHLVNEGDGDDATDPEFGLGVMALGEILELRRREGAPIPTGLTTQVARMVREPDGFYDVPV